MRFSEETRALLTLRAELWGGAVHRLSLRSDAAMDRLIASVSGICAETDDARYFHQLRRGKRVAGKLAQRSVNLPMVAVALEELIPELKGTACNYTSPIWDFCLGKGWDTHAFPDADCPAHQNISSVTNNALARLGWTRFKFDEWFSLRSRSELGDEPFLLEIESDREQLLASRRLLESDAFLLDKLHVASLLWLEAKAGGWFWFEETWRSAVEGLLRSEGFESLFRELGASRARAVLQAAISSAVSREMQRVSPDYYGMARILSVCESAATLRRANLRTRIFRLSGRLVRVVAGLRNRTDSSPTVDDQRLAADSEIQRLVRDLQACNDEWAALMQGADRFTVGGALCGSEI